MIVRERMSADLVGCAGLAFIGDPHVSSRRPGRRKDADYVRRILDKVEFCLDHASRNDLFPIFLGDFYDVPVIEDETVKTMVSRLLRRSRYVPVENLGNHTSAHSTLSDGDSLMTLATSDLLDVVVETTPVYEFSIGGVRIGLGATPYGRPIPEDVSSFFPEADRVIWLTHHDIAFDGAYPGATPPFEIRGCDVVVNGHIHATKPPVAAGATTWCNFGNINRQSVDLADHVPCLWVLGPDGAFAPVEIPHVKDVFDMTGRLVRTAGGREVVRAETGSAFVEMMRRETALDLEKSEDGSLVLEAVEAQLASEETPPAVEAIVRSLLAEVVSARSAG